jgi:hypothetical protein
MSTTSEALATTLEQRYRDAAADRDSSALVVLELQARVAELEAVVKSCEFTLAESRAYGVAKGAEASAAKEHAEYVSSVLGAATTRLEQAQAELAAEREKVRALTADRDRVLADFVEADGHVEACQIWLAEQGIECGGDGSVLHGMGRLLEERDEALASRHDLAMRVAERVREAVREAVLQDSPLPAPEDLAALVAECEASHG